MSGQLGLGVENLFLAFLCRDTLLYFVCGLASTVQYCSKCFGKERSVFGLLA